MGIENLIKEINEVYCKVSIYASDYAEMVDCEYSDDSYYSEINKCDKKFYRLMDNLRNYNLKHYIKEGN